MQTQPKFSTNKIVFLLTFLCVAIMTSLFVYHTTHKPKPLLSSEEGLIFPTARDIKSFALMTANKQAFTQQDFLGHWTLLFFGFTHCASACPTTLEMLNRAYQKLTINYPTLQVVLVSLDPERDTPLALANYTHSFNPKFIGVTGNIQELRKLQSQFGIAAVRDDTTSATYQIQHTSSILLINPRGQWAGLFKYGLNPEQLTQAFTKSVVISS